MEKYGQYRDKGSGIAPFFPISPPASNPLLLPWHLLLFSIRIPLLAFAWAVWLVLIQWLRPGGLLRKANLWCILRIPGVWWVDLQIDGLKRGSLSRGRSERRLPEPGTIIASSYTSPLDVLYLAAIFDPIFTQSYAGRHKVRALTLESAWAACFSIGGQKAPPDESLVDLSKLIEQNQNRIVVVFPEATTSNGRGILTFSPSLLSVAESIKVFPVSLRYTPAEIVTPIPGWLEAARFIWRLNSRQTHCIRVRISSPKTMPSLPVRGTTNGSPASVRKGQGSGFESNYFDTLQSSSPSEQGTGDPGAGHDENDMSERERRALDAVADDLARLGRVKRVNLGVEEKARFVEAWRRRKGSR